MTRRTVTIEPKLDQIINFVRGFFLLIGQEYNYTEVVNYAIFYGICYWLNIPHDKAVEMAPQFVSTNLRIEGLKDEERDEFMENILSKLTLISR